MSKRILVAPLDWGLGHAARCIPIIKALMAKGHEPVLASDGRAYELLHAEFPDLEIYRLPGYKPIYREDGNMVMAMGRQLPHFMGVIAQEHSQLEKWIPQLRLDGVISDNRYGLHSKLRPTVFITHQVNIQMPTWASFLSGAVKQTNQYFISKFNRCWIPDVPGENSLAGKLSQPQVNKGHYRFIGHLSRLDALPDIPKQYDLLVLLSGPEPQRTLLEQKIRRQLEFMDNKTFLVQGITERKELDTVNDDLDVCSYLASEELAIALASSEVVVARSGYTTIMELAATGKPALLIPTPGQTEQEYLAQDLDKRGFFHTVSQQNLNLAHDLALVDGYTPPVPSPNTLLLPELDDWLSGL